MPSNEHKVPTHLNVEDRAFYGLTARQLTHLLAGAASGYGLWNQWPELPGLFRGGLAFACFAVAVLLALVRPAGRGLEEWAFVVLRYAVVPRLSVWRLPEPELVGNNPSSHGLRDVAPRLAWNADRSNRGDRLIQKGARS